MLESSNVGTETNDKTDKNAFNDDFNNEIVN